LPQGVFLTHPFALERVQYLQEWSTSREYQQIRNGNYRRTGEGAVDVTADPSAEVAEVARLQREVEELQREIDRVRKGNP
jgi:hypothetical protein